MRPPCALLRLFLTLCCGCAAIFALAISAVCAQSDATASSSPAAAAAPGGVSAEDAADFGEAAVPITALRGTKDKTLIFVFDVSGSMRDGGNLRRARTATINILREGALPGDHVALLTFGAGTKKVFDTTLQTRADVSSLIQQVPTDVEPGEGTNIREPHHEALKIVDADLPHPGVIVLLTDSFNDEPKTTDPVYADYLKYYTPGGRLFKYPNTPENRDYERLLKKLLRSGKLHQYGIGIKIAPDGRPIERLPQAAPPPVEAPDTAPAAVPPPPAEKPTNPLLYLWGLLGLGLIGGAFAVLKPMLATTALRITGGPAGKKDFAIKSGQTVRLGGEGASVAWDAYALPAAAKEPVAIIRGLRGQLVLSPPTTAAGQKNGMGVSNPDAALRVYHNGLVLERDAPLRYGDEVRISVPPASGVGGVPKEYRLRFEDPRKSF